MFFSQVRAAALAVVAGFSLSACAYGEYGYGGVSVGLGSGGYYDDYDPYYGSYYDPFYDGYYGSRARFGRGYSSGFGWYDGFYYPGTGFYVYDRFRQRHRWNDGQRRYWEGRRGLRQHFRGEDRAFRQHFRDERRAFRRGEVTRDQFRAHRREENRAFREHRRSHRRGHN